MKKILIYIAGVVTGIVLTIAVIFFIGLAAGSQSPNKYEEATNGDGNEIIRTADDGSSIVFFEKPGDIIEVKSFKVFQVVSKNSALVMSKDEKSGLYTGMVYAIYNQTGKYYYDDEIINVPKGKVVKQVGIYRYPTPNDFIKTVPIIMILDK